MGAYREDWRLNSDAGGIFSAITMFTWRLGVCSRNTAGPAGIAGKLLHRVLDTVWVKAVIGSDLPTDVILGRRIFLAHGGRGVFVADGVSIGDDCTVHQQVTIGETLGRSGVPRIGSRVYIGTKASIFGDVAIGDDVTIAAHAAVVKTVPSGSVARGVPARSYDRTLTESRPKS